MGKQTPRLVVAALIVAALVTLALQNSTPTLTLTFLGWQTIALPLGVWLSSAIALGALTALIMLTLTTSHRAAGPANRRRWTVRPETETSARDRTRRQSSTAESGQRNWNLRSPQEFFRRDNPRNAAAKDAPPRDPPRREPPRDSDRRRDESRARATTPPPSNAVAAEDWQAWGQRNAPSKWDDWSQAGGPNPEVENMPRRQRRDREKAEATIHDLDQGWDDTAQETVYVAPGGSQVEDTLDDIVDGWEDWDSDDNPLADTAYAASYDGVDKANRRDSIYAPPDDDSDADNDQVYDADYRVIIPPYRPLDDEENEGDRPT